MCGYGRLLRGKFRGLLHRSLGAGRDLRIWGLFCGSFKPCDVVGVVMSQFWGGRLRIWGLSCVDLRQGFEDMSVVMSQFGGGRLRIGGLLCRSSGAGG